MSIQNDHLMGIIRSCLCLPEDDKDYEIHFARFINGNETVNSFCMNNTTDNRVVKKNPAFISWMITSWMQYMITFYLII